MDEPAAHEPPTDVLDRMSDGFFTVNGDWEFTYLNDRAAELIGRDRDALMGAQIWEEFGEARGTDFEEAYRTAMERDEEVAFEEYYAPLDTWFGVRVYPADDGIAVYIQDITERRERDAKLRANRRALEGLYEVAADLDLTFDEKVERALNLGTTYLGVEYGFLTRIEDGDQTLKAVVGGTKPLEVGYTQPLDKAYCRKTIEGPEGVLVVDDAVAEGWEDDPAYEAYGLGCYLGSRIELEGELYGTLCFASDDPRGASFTNAEQTFVELLTEWLHYELQHQRDKARLEEKNEQLEEFTSIVSHDLRNPLAAAQGYLDVARANTDLDRLDDVAKEHERMERLISELLVLAREGELVDEREPVGLGRLFEEAKQAADEDEIEVTVVDEFVFSADRDRMRQVVENLLRNAQEHASDEDGAVTVTAGTTEDGFYVADDGPGIPAEEREQVFESGYSTAHNGTGFGLSIVERVAEAHGWTVTVEESESGGARFVFHGVEAV
jgi:signal transduction histidine kinase